MIPTKVHGLLDYLFGILLVAMPWLLKIGDNNAETLVFVIAGVVTIIYSMYTNYELGAWPYLSMSTHLVIDTIQAIVLAASPWIFGFADDMYIPYVAAGVLELLVVTLSSRKPQVQEDRSQYAGRFSEKGL